MKEDRRKYMSPLHSDEREKNARGGVGSNVKPKH
jgi:hypothetical protein